MSDLTTLQSAYKNKRTARANVDLDLQQAKAAHDKLLSGEEQQLRGLDEAKREDLLRTNATEKNRLTNLITGLSSAREDADRHFKDLAATVLNTLDPPKATAELDDSLPILLFPLRLETRFKQGPNTRQLWLRVFPDDCNVNAKETLLSEFELSTARSFWIDIWKAGGVEAEERAAWRSFVNSHGTGRCAWIIREYKPTNVKPIKPANKKILVVVSTLVLTTAEVTAARDYWAAHWLAQGVASAITNAFNALKAATSDARAGEILRNYAPVNLSDSVPTGMVAGDVLLEKLDLPTSTGKQSSWTQAARATLLPDKFVAIGYNGTIKRTVIFPRPVREQLSVSVDPSLTGADQVKKDSDDNLELNADLLWMADFDAAIEAGMGVKIDLPATEINGFDKLVVLGIRFRSDADESRVQLEQLLEDHFYSKRGFGLIRQGTPTNNTEDLPAGYSWTDDPDQSYSNIFLHREDFTHTTELDQKSDGQKLADYLGIDSEILKLVPNANGKDQLAANAMNRALFPATLGYFLDEMMDPLFSDADVEDTRRFFANFVSGRGPIPAIRIGRQPYGILPVSVYSKMDFGDIGELPTGKKPYPPRLHLLLKQIDVTWKSLVSRVAFIGKPGDAHQILLDVVGLHPTSVEFHQRYSQTLLQLYNQMVLQLGPFLAALVAGAIAEKARAILVEYGLPITTKLPILDKVLLSEPNLLKGPLVDDVPDSEINKIRDYSADGLNYLEWLVAAAPEKIRTEDFGGNARPTALLYLLLRHSLMLAQADAASTLLLTSNLITDKKAFRDPDFLFVEKTETGKSKFEHLFATQPLITGSNTLTLADHIYKPDVLATSPETRRLRDLVNALKVLKDLPTAALERLLAEHVDCCSYRLDAWKTGIVNFQLTKQRTRDDEDGNFSRGILLGAYGWLLDVRPANKVLSDVTLTPELTRIFNKGNAKPLQRDSANLGYIHAPSLNQAATAAILRNAFDSNKGTGSGNPFAINLTSDRVRMAANFLEGIRNGQSLAALLGYQFERGLHDKYSLGQGEVDQFIFPLRKKFPLVADSLVSTTSDPTASIETIEARNVIDGVKLINHVQKSAVKNYPYGLTGLPGANPVQRKAIDDEVNRITEIHDAIADLVISEQVYQVVQGNFDRASGNAEAFGKGSYPPEVEIINTPRSGVTITHRMAVQFDAESDPATSPNSIPNMTPRARVEPSINKWLSDVLPDPQKVLCKVTYSSPVQPATEVDVSQHNLGLQPIDLLYSFNLETEQAMTELDDRIRRYIRYSVSLHPKTDIFIDYTKPIDSADKTKISFFELSALLKSLRKIILGAKYLSPASVMVPQEGSSQKTILDDAQLRTRITSLKNGLLPLETRIATILTSTISISSLTDSFKTQLQSAISDSAQVESLLTQLGQDLKNYLLTPDAATKNATLTTFANSIAALPDVAVKAALRTSYSNSLDAYANDFSNLDQLASDTVSVFMDMALLDNSQTGTGFIHEGIAGAYASVFGKLTKLVERWERKKSDAETLLGQSGSLPTDEARMELLKKVEQLISATLTAPTPTILSAYRTIVDTKKAQFDAQLNGLTGLLSNGRQKITDFLSDAQTLINSVSSHDVIPFDIDRSKNDLGAELLALSLLKETIVTALNNLKTALTAKLALCNTELSSANTTVVNADRITALLNAAKAVMGDQALVLPHFTLDATQGTEFENSVLAHDSILDFVRANEKRDFPVDDWLSGVARVRDKAHEWENTCFLSKAFKSSSLLELAPIQLPFKADDRWFAMKFRDEADPTDKFAVSNDTLLYSVHFASAFDKTRRQCGVIIDEWTEVIPATMETTGITFHYDQPGSEPPQTMLLVTPPQLSGNWKWNDIVEALEETLEMARTRAVEPSQIESTAYAQVLPAIMMAVTSYWITIATNLSINNITEAMNN